MKPFIYFRGLRHVDFGVFCVEKEQKTYLDPLFNRFVPYSSGQQVKRSILTSLTENLHRTFSPVTFVLNPDSTEQHEAFSTCDPSYIDLLIGGWMRATSIDNSDEKEDSDGNAKKRKKEKLTKERNVKRRSPLSISAMTPLHPLLVSTPQESITFDRSAFPENNTICFKDKKGKIIDVEDIAAILDSRNQKPFNKYIPNKRRASGLFVYNVAIDLRTLFCVSLNEYERELDDDIINKLKTTGWVESKNVFGKCLVLPKEERDKVIPVLAESLLNWHISSNQSRTFSLMETLAIAISDNANTLAAAIRSKLLEEGDNAKAKPIVDEHAGADVYVTLPCAGYIVTESESADAMQRAKEKLVNLMMDFDYEHQI